MSHPLGESMENRNIMPEFVICPVMENVLNVIGRLSMYPSQVDPTHLKRGAAEMLDSQLELDFGER